MGNPYIFLQPTAHCDVAIDVVKQTTVYRGVEIIVGEGFGG